jgi:phosphoglycolate phosphatase
LYKLAIFDFDGTLVDSAPGIVDVMKQVVGEYNLPQTIFDEWQHLVGVTLMRQMELIFPNHPEDFWLEVAQRYRAIYDVRNVEMCPPFPGLGQMLEELKKASVMIAIVSSKRRNLIEPVLAHHSISAYFSLVVGSQDVSNHKPHPEAVHHTVDKLGMSHHEAVVIGDSIYDLDMARNAGVDAIGVTTGIHTKEILAKAEPREIVGSLAEVTQIIINGRITH